MTPLGHHTVIRAWQDAGLSLGRDFFLVTQGLVHTANRIPTITPHTPVTQKEQQNEDVEDKGDRPEWVVTPKRSICDGVYSVRTCPCSPDLAALDTLSTGWQFVHCVDGAD